MPLEPLERALDEAAARFVLELQEDVPEVPRGMGVAPTPVGAERGPHEPNQTWVGRETLDGQVVIMRTDQHGWEYEWLYLFKEEAAHLGKILMERLAKEALGTG